MSTFPFDKRFSPRLYTNKKIKDEDIRSIFEAARWAQTSFHEEPWRFLLCKKDSIKRKDFESVLYETNSFSKQADVLGLVLSKKHFTKKPDITNLHHWFDAGAACQIASLRAFELGIGMRFMAGFEREKSKSLISDPKSEFDIVCMFCMGYADPSYTPPPQSRNPFESFVFFDEFCA